MPDDKLVRIPGDTLLIQETEVEIKYRRKHFPDFKQVSGKKLVCTSCNKNISRQILSGKEIFIHNILGVLLCGDCHTFYGDGCFSMDEDGDDKYCRWCGQGGTLFCCAKCSCAFCKKCIKSNLNRGVLDEVEDDDWQCFVCNPEPLFAIRSLCWAASKYYDYVNEKENTKKRASGSGNISDDDRKKNKKRTRGDCSDDSPKPKRSKFEKSDKNEKAKQSVNENESSDENRSVKSKPLNKQSHSRLKKKDVEEDLSESSDDNRQKSKAGENKTSSSESDKVKTKRLRRSRAVQKKDSSSDTDEEVVKSKETNRRSKRHTKKVTNDTDENSSKGRESNRNVKHSKKESNSSENEKPSMIEKKETIKSQKKSSVSKEKNRIKSSESRSTSDSSLSSILNEKKVLKSCNNWLMESLRDIEDLGSLMIERCKYLKEKPNLNSFKEAKVKFTKVNKMIKGIFDNINYIEGAFNENNKKFMRLIGEEVDECSESQNKGELNMETVQNEHKSEEKNEDVTTNGETSNNKQNENKEFNELSAPDINDKIDKSSENKEDQNGKTETHDVKENGMEVEDSLGLDRSNDEVKSEDESAEKLSQKSISAENTRSSQITENKDEISNFSPDKTAGEIDELLPSEGEVEPQSVLNKSEDKSGDGSKKQGGTSKEDNSVLYSPDVSDEELEQEKSKCTAKLSDSSPKKSSNKLNDSVVSSDVTVDELMECKNSEEVLKAQEEILKSSSSGESTSEDFASDKNDEDFTKKKKLKKKSKRKEKESKNEIEEKAQLSKDKESKSKKETQNSDSDKDIEKLTDLSKIDKKKKERDSSVESKTESEDKKDKENDEKNESAVDESDVDENTPKDVDKQKVKKQKKKDEKEDILDFFNKDHSDASEDNVSTGNLSIIFSDSSNLSEGEKKQKTIEKEQAMEKEDEDYNLKILMASSGSEGNKNDIKSDDSDLENILTTLEEKKKRKVKEKAKTENENEEEKEKEQSSNEDNEKNDTDKEKENDENKSDEENKISGKNSSDTSFNSSDDLIQQELIKKNRKKWRKNRLLKLNVSGDTSDEDRLWNRQKERLKKRRQKQENEDYNSLDEFENRIKEKINKKQNAILNSEDDEEKKKAEKGSSSSSVHLSSDSSSSESEEIFRKVKRKKSSASSVLSISSSSEDKKVKKKRKRIKSPVHDNEDSSASDGDQVLSQKSNLGESPGKGGRKNIRKLLDTTDLAEATKLAAKEEEERRKRILQRQKLFNEIFEISGDAEVIEKLVLDFDPETKDELLSVHPALVSKMKPHQAKGVKFMWDCCFESLSQLKTKKGSGCILAHCMGLGKTFQVVTLIHTVITHKETNVKSVLVVCPLSTVLNWYNEFNKWLKDVDNENRVEVYHLTIYKKNFARARHLKEWHDEGGVMIIGYEMFRNLSADGKKFRVKLREMFQESLLDPGPDLIICDEGHMLKNEATALSKAMTKVTTRRRIVLTGTPLQNNLKEYHCMVQFVRPNLLGTRKEFLNRFVNPITNGQFVDSTDHDVRVMKRRAHVLHKMLEGLIQRFDYNVLTPFLPPKHEYVIKVRLSEVQIKLYQHYLDNLAQGGGGQRSGSSLFSDFQSLSRIWTHPLVVRMSTEKADKEAKKKADLEDSEGSLKDFIDDSDKTSSSSSSVSSSNDESDEEKEPKSLDETKKDNDNVRSTRSTRANPIKEANEEEEDKEEKEKPAWWKSIVEEDHFDDINQSAKLVMLLEVLRQCEMIEDKVLVFSQSLYSLNLIEYFLEKIDSATTEGQLAPNLGNHVGSWVKGLDYFRLDGASSSENRNIWCKSFNSESNTRARLFLISTRAGGLGINLVGANRVIIFDASWNPSHDVQSIFRIYRFGQKKPCYVYRFIAQGTMEEKVYDRQVAKLSLSSRVVDEQQAHRLFSHNDLQELYTFTPKPKSEREVPKLPKDKMMAELLQICSDWIEAYHEHDSLIEHVIDEELNEEERKLAWEDYEKEKASGGLSNQGQGVGGIGMGFGNLESIRASLAKRFPSASEEDMNRMLSTFMRQVQTQQQQKLLQQQQNLRYQQMLRQQQQYLQNQKAVAAGSSFNQMKIPQAHQNVPFGVPAAGNLAYNNRKPHQMYNYNAQLAYQTQLQMINNRFSPQTTSGTQKPKTDADTQNKKDDPEIVHLD